MAVVGASVAGFCTAVTPRSPARDHPARVCRPGGWHRAKGGSLGLAPRTTASCRRRASPTRARTPCGTSRVLRGPRSTRRATRRSACPTGSSSSSRRSTTTPRRTPGARGHRRPPPWCTPPTTRTTTAITRPTGSARAASSCRSSRRGAGRRCRVHASDGGGLAKRGIDIRTGHTAGPLSTSSGRWSESSANGREATYVRARRRVRDRRLQPQRGAAASLPRRAPAAGLLRPDESGRARRDLQATRARLLHMNAANMSPIQLERVIAEIRTSGGSSRFPATA